MALEGGGARAPGTPLLPPPMCLRQKKLLYNAFVMVTQQLFIEGTGKEYTLSSYRNDVSL